ncbi:MAG: PilZ domain-containing protein [Gammaproteobacteria bacterium]|nr:PilZ domain-containing protein [Gammaproteobacteria bacterium]
MSNVLENLPEFNDDRREFFRINDSIYLTLNPIDSTDVANFITVLRNKNTHDTNSEQQQLTTLQNAFSHVVDQVNQTDREVARALRLLNDKINLISQIVNRQKTRPSDCVSIDVNLSGGGLALMSEHEYQKKQAFEFKIELRPSGSTIQGIASVIGCSQPYDARKDTPYLLRLVFSHMTEHDRNLLVKHTLTRQAEILRASKE